MLVITPTQIVKAQSNIYKDSTLYFSVFYNFGWLELNQNNDGRRDPTLPSGIGVDVQLMYKSNWSFHLGYVHKNTGTNRVNGFVFNELGGFNEGNQDSYKHELLEIPVSIGYTFVNRESLKMLVVAGPKYVLFKKKYLVNEAEYIQNISHLAVNISLRETFRLNKNVSVFLSEGVGLNTIGELKLLRTTDLQFGLTLGI